LASLGVSAEKINKLAENPNVKSGDTSESTFDMTEEKSATEAGPILAEAAKTL